MIVFRHADNRFPFLWESNAQPAARWHGGGEGPVQYFCDTTYGAWAEFVRHEAITTVDELEDVTRALWAVELPDPPTSEPNLDDSLLRGGLSSYASCQQEARRLRAAGAAGIKAPSAALLPGQAAGFVTYQGTLRVGPPRDGIVYVIFGTKLLVGWRAAEGGVPSEILKRVNPL